MADAKQLQVGDVIYLLYRDEIIKRYVIDRVDETLAFVNGADYDFVRTVSKDGKVYLDGFGKWHRLTKCYIESPFILEKWARRELLIKIDNMDRYGMPIDQLRRIIAIIEEKPGSVPSDLATGIPTLDRQEK